MIVAPSSQSFYEAYVLGVPVINVDPLTGNADRIREINPNASLSQKVSYTPGSYDETLDLLKGDLARLPPVPEIDDHLDQFHDWFAPEAATRRAVDEIVNVARSRNKGTIARMPTAVMDAWDRVSFRRVCAREPRHPNFSYHRHHHRVPEHMEQVIANIDAKNSILGRDAQG